jgi:hypothetical protein
MCDSCDVQQIRWRLVWSVVMTTTSARAVNLWSFDVIAKIHQPQLILFGGTAKYSMLLQPQPEHTKPGG